MVRLSHIINVVMYLALFCLAAPHVYGSQLYSYLDENGVRHFTSTAPTGPVQDLKITGNPPVVKNQEPVEAPPVSARERRYDPIIEKYATKYGVDASLIRSMIAKESNFNARAVSPKGARGLMQLMPETATRVGVRNVYDPEENIRGGVLYMRKLMDKFDNNVVLSLAAYNAGENLVQRIGRVPNYRETKDYVRTITARYGKKEVAPKVEVARNNTPMNFQYRDNDGVLHLTNIPPVQRNDESSSWTVGQ